MLQHCGPERRSQEESSACVSCSFAPEPVGALCARSFGDAQTVPILFEGRAVKRLVVPDGHDDRPQPNYRWIVERPIRGVGRCRHGSVREPW